MQSIESLLLLVATLAVAGMVTGIIINISGDVSSTITETTGGEVDQVNANIEIVSDIGSSGVYDSGTNTLTLLVQNTGERELERDEILIQVDGKYVDIDSFEVIDDSVWVENNIARITATTEISGENRVTVYVQGDDDTIHIYTG